MSGDETKVQLISDGKFLIVNCSKADFAAILQAVCTQIGYADPTTDVVDMQVSDNSWRQKSPHTTRLRDRVALVGCALVAFPFLIVFVAGIARILEILSY